MRSNISFFLSVHILKMWVVCSSLIGIIIFVSSLVSTFNDTMSWFKFWSRSKSKSKDIKDEYQKELKRAESLREDSHLTEAEREKQKLKHTLSISRSGRFKHKKRERGAILDQPELFDKTLDNANGGRPTVKPPNPPSGHSRSPNNTCRDVRDVFQSSYPSHVAAVWQFHNVVPERVFAIMILIIHALITWSWRSLCIAGTSTRRMLKSYFAAEE